MSDKSRKLPTEAVPVKETLVNAEMHDLSHAREARCVPIVHELLKLLAVQEQVPVGMHTNEKLGEIDYYKPTVHAFLKMLIDKDVQVAEVAYIFTMARQALDFVMSSIDETLNQNMNRNTEAMYGLAMNDFDLVTVKKLNQVVMHRHLIAEVWNPILEQPVENVDTGVAENKEA